MGKVSPSPPLAAAELAAATTSTAEMNNRKKKKGRPSLIDIQKRNLLKQQQQQQQQDHKPLTTSSPTSNLNRRSTRRNPSPELEDDNDDDERDEKKVKLVVRLPQQQEEQRFDNLPRSSSLNSDLGTSGSDEEGGNPEAASKKRKISVATDRSGDNNLVGNEVGKVAKSTDHGHGSALDSGPTTSLPDKKLLVFILDRLQKKDTYSAFSEPVDPDELPDYHETIENPMDFGTVRTKLDAGLYSNLEQLEADVFLICSNAMQYNSSDTVYFRQARSIKELAKRDFENLRHEGEDGELQPKVIRRGRPPSKHLKKPPSSTSVDRIEPELSSGATLATMEENTNTSNTYSLRKAPMLYKFHNTESILSSHGPRNGENYSEGPADWNDEFPARILKADMKHGRRLDLIDETRRDTYKQFHPSAFSRKPSLLSDFGGGTKQLMPVGLHVEHSYARSVARFAAKLGPVVWEIASKKLASVLPPGVKFGPSFIGENEASLELPSFSYEKSKSSSSLARDGNKTRAVTPSTSGLNPVVTSGLQGKKDMVEMDRRLSSQNEVAVSQGTPLSGIRPGQTFTSPNKPVFHPDRNGFNGVFGYHFSSQPVSVQPGMRAGHSGLEEASLPSQHPSTVPKSEPSSTPSPLTNNVDPEEQKYSDSMRTSHHGTSAAPSTGREWRPLWQEVTPHPRQYSPPVQSDLNVRLQTASSPSSGLRVGSPQQPDLALQL